MGDSRRFGDLEVQLFDSAEVRAVWRGLGRPGLMPGSHISNSEDFSSSQHTQNLIYGPLYRRISLNPYSARGGRFLVRFPIIIYWFIIIGGFQISRPLGIKI